MLLQVLTLSLSLLGSFAHPAPGETSNVARQEVSPSSAASDISPAVVPPDEPWQGKLPELDWSVSSRDKQITDISTRADDVGNFRRFTYLGLQGFAMANAGVQLFNIAKDCREFGDEAANSFNCVWASISTVIGFAVLVDRAIIVRGHLSDRLSESGWHVPGINKRDEIPQLETQLSALLSAEVRHVGIWDGDDNETRSLSKRSGGVVKAVPRHIFGANFQGRDMHFTYMGELNNGSHFRIGNGPGPETENNRRHLRSRKTHKYNNQYFDNGGLDFIQQTDPDNSNNGGIYITPEDPNEFNWIVDQVACYLSSWDFFVGTSLMMSHGLNFQVFNSYDSTTLAAGAIAPFEGDKASAISEMPLMGGIDTKRSCTIKTLGKS